MPQSSASCQMGENHSFSRMQEENLALRPNVRIAVSVPHPIGGGSRDPEVLSDVVPPTASHQN